MGSARNRPPDVVWVGPIRDIGAEASLGQRLAPSLADGRRVEVIDTAAPVVSALDSAAAQWFLQQHCEGFPSGSPVRIQCGPLSACDPYIRCGRRVAITRLPGGDVPPLWAARARLMDLVVVPDAPQAGRLIDAGVEEDRVWVMGPVCDPAAVTAPPADLDGLHGTVFLTTAAPVDHDGWELVVRAWAQAFRSGDDVTLVIASWSAASPDGGVMQQRLLQLLEDAGIDPEALADVVLLTELLSPATYAGLVARSDVLVRAPSAIGWGLAEAEAMFAGRPVVAPGVAEGCGWPVADATADEATRIDDLVCGMQAAHGDPDERRRRGARAADVAVPFDRDAVASRLWNAIAGVRPQPSRPPRHASTPSLVVSGRLYAPDSLAGVNRDLVRALERRDDIEVAMLNLDAGGPIDPGPEVAAATARHIAFPDVMLHHGYPPVWGYPSPAAVRTHMLHWEFGPLPQEWVHALGDSAEVWGASRWVGEWMVRSGVPAQKVHYVPLGVDPGRFHPEVPAMTLPGCPEGFRFLFVGGFNMRKGFDVLFEAYASAFTAADDVVLVVKDYGAGGPYGESGPEHIARLKARPGIAPVHYLRVSLDEHEIPGLYRAADCVVHPFRGEAYGLTIVEAMACDVPVIITDGGPVHDYASADTALLVPSTPLHLAERAVPPYELCGTIEMIDVSADDLARRMRYAYENRDDIAAMGRRAGHHVRTHHNWDRCAEVVTERVRALADALRDGSVNVGAPSLKSREPLPR